MLRKLLGMGLLLATLAGCTTLEGKECSSDSDCGGETGRCDVATGLCYKAGTEPEIENCSPACAAYEACTTVGCRPRFTSLTILSPANNAVVGAGTVQVQAQLVANPTYADKTQFPDTLNFSASRNDGGDVGSFGAVTRNGDTYTVAWTPPSTQAQVVLTAGHPTPAAVPSASVTVQVDTVAPDFTISFSTPPDRLSGSPTQAAQADEATGYESAFRRDESVTVTVAANEPVSNVTLTVVGIGAGGAAGQAQSPVTLVGGASGCTGSPAFCGSTIVNLSTPEMSVFRGTMDFRVEGQDSVGNRGSKAAGLKVTRWKWAFNAAGAINSTPAVGSRGTVYFGTDDTSGKMFAVGPDGALKWPAPLPLGQMGASPAVGALNGTEEYVYVSAKGTSGTFFYALQGSNGTEKAKCTLAGNNEVESAVAVGTTALTVGTAETGVVIYNGNPPKIIGLRPDAVLTDPKCIEIAGSGPTTLPLSVPGSSVVMKDQKVFYAATGSRLTCYDFATGSNSPCMGWPQNTNSLARGLTLLDEKIYGGAGNSDDPTLGSLFSSPLTGGPSGGAVSFVYPNANTSRVFNLAIGSGKVAYFGAETASTGELLALLLEVGGATPTRAADTGTMRGAPAIGKNDRLYTLNTQGRVSAWVASTVAPLWHLDLSLGLSSVDVSPTLDCRRDATGQILTDRPLGTLYIGGNTKLYAFIVESPGLDPAAPWPKFQHDARNTGNAATPITTCP